MFQFEQIIQNSIKTILIQIDCILIDNRLIQVFVVNRIKIIRPLANNRFLLNCGQLTILIFDIDSVGGRLSPIALTIFVGTI